MQDFQVLKETKGQRLEMCLPLWSNIVEHPGKPGINREHSVLGLEVQGVNVEQP